MRDLLVVAGKEMREIVGAGGGRRGLIRELLFIGIFGVFFPLSQAEAWRTGSVPAVFAMLIPLFLVGPHVADSFAGERERGTLETLLATRLPDAAIYFGKILAVCLYSWLVTLLIIVVSLVALNVSGAGNGGAPGRIELVLYPGFVWLAWGLGSIASGLLLAGIGTFVSLRSTTVRGAHQALMIPLFVLIFGASFGIPALFGRLPAPVREQVLARFDELGATDVVLVFSMLLLVVDALVLALGGRLFRRDRLISR